MWEQLISGSSGYDIETFIRIPGFSPLLMNYLLLLNGLQFSPKIAHWDFFLFLAQLNLEEALF